jgi:hypothetical protein
MPRPTTAQVAYGCLTVVLFTLAVLLLADVTSGAGVVAVATAGLVLGLVVATAVRPQNHTSVVVTTGPAPSGSVPRARVGGGAESLVSEHSLRN